MFGKLTESSLSEERMLCRGLKLARRIVEEDVGERRKMIDEALLLGWSW